MDDVSTSAARLAASASRGLLRVRTGRSTSAVASLNVRDRDRRAGRRAGELAGEERRLDELFFLLLLLRRGVDTGDSAVFFALLVLFFFELDFLDAGDRDRYGSRSPLLSPIDRRDREAERVMR